MSTELTPESWLNSVSSRSDTEFVDVSFNVVFDTDFVDASYFVHLAQVLWMIVLLWSSDGFCRCIILWSPVTGFVDRSYRVLWMDHTVIV